MIIIQLKNRIFGLDEKQFEVSLGSPSSATEDDDLVYVPASWDELVNRIESYPDITVQVIYYNGRFLHNTARWFGGPDDFILMPNERKDIDFVNEQLNTICGGMLTRINTEE